MTVCATDRGRAALSLDRRAPFRSAFAGSLIDLGHPLSLFNVRKDGLNYKFKNR
jgi:hypothetical protein